jgi:hypothetical protein
MESTDEDVEAAAKYAAKYDGPTEFTAKYKISLKCDKSFDPDNSTVKFTLTYFTVKVGKKTEKNDGKDSKGNPWETLSIKITGVKLNAAKTDVESFTFAADKWYPNLEKKYKPLVNAGLSGAVDFTTKKANWTSQYNNANNGVITIYTTTGAIK